MVLFRINILSGLVLETEKGKDERGVGGFDKAWLSRGEKSGRKLARAQTSNIDVYR